MMIPRFKYDHICTNLFFVQIFDEGELELLMCGIGSIDVKVISFFE